MSSPAASSHWRASSLFQAGGRVGAKGGGVTPGGGVGDFLRVPPAGALSAAANTNFVALPGPAALWIVSRSASVSLKANTTNGTLGAFSFLGFGSLTGLGSFAALLTCFSLFGLLMWRPPIAGHHARHEPMNAWVPGTSQVERRAG